MSGNLQTVPKEADGSLTIADATDTPNYYVNGLPFDTGSTLAVDYTGAIASYYQGLPLTAEGRIACTKDAVDRVSSGLPIAASEKVSMTGDAPSYYAGGVPYSSGGTLAGGTGVPA